ncbi:hypothetical protein HanIR_Chr13g0633141 [Helianthus annuus]|nr:hypothetical protein HanIR_Chr13g0633141 [Helianthus annuus]
MIKLISQKTPMFYLYYLLSIPMLTSRESEEEEAGFENLNQLLPPLALPAMVVVQPPFARAQVVDYTQKKGPDWPRVPPTLSPRDLSLGLHCFGRACVSPMHL